jgi:AcrR family transcriptional regulator
MTTEAPPTSAAPPAPSRRDRQRERTIEEIKAAARAQLTTAGPDGIQLRAVARAVGLTAPALYRYFPSLEDLVDAVTVDLFDELVAELERARDAQPADDLGARLWATSHAFRDYAIAHPSDFRLMFGTPPGTLGQDFSDSCSEASARFGNVFAAQFRAVWEEVRFPVLSDDELADGVADEIHQYWSWIDADFAPGMPKGAVVSFIQAWIRLYGLVAMEVFGHLNWALTDARPLLDQLLADIAREWGVEPCGPAVP